MTTELKKAPTRIELVIRVLQTLALPLGYGAACSIYNTNKSKMQE